MKPDFLIVSGNANRDLAIAVARLLDVDLAKCRVERFADTEINVRIEEPVRGRRILSLIHI